MNSTIPAGWKDTGAKVGNGLTVYASERGMAFFNLTNDFSGIVEIYQYQVPCRAKSFAYSQARIYGSNSGVVWDEASSYFVPTNTYLYPQEMNNRQFFIDKHTKAGAWELTGVSTSSIYYFGGQYFLNGSFGVGTPESISIWSGVPNGTDISVKSVFVSSLLPNNRMPVVSMVGIGFNSVPTVTQPLFNSLATLAFWIVIGFAADTSVALIIHHWSRTGDYRKSSKESEESLPKTQRAKDDLF